jgi:hypothetical protein
MNKWFVPVRLFERQSQPVIYLESDGAAAEPRFGSITCIINIHRLIQSISKALPHFTYR